MYNLALADTGTTGYHITLDSPWDNKQQAVHPLPIQITNGGIITSTYTALLSHQDLPIQARKSYLFPDLNKFLLSIGTLCDHGFEATFNDNSALILKNGVEIL